MKKLLFAVLAAGLLFTACKQGGGNTSSFANQQDSVAYALGLSLGQSTLKDGIKLDPSVLKQGYDETMNETTTMTKGSFEQSMRVLQMELQARGANNPFTDQDPPKANLDTVAYALGYNVATNLLNTGLNFDAGIIANGYSDGLGGSEGFDSTTIAGMMVAMQTLQQKGFEEKQRVEGEKNQKAGEAYLNENKDKDGVVVLPSGLQYKIEREGSGASPLATETVSVHYEGRLIDGTIFDSSYERGSPVEFPVQGVIAGWTEALQLMKPGAKWQVYIPGDLAYGLRGSPPKIGPNATLVFDVELLEVK